MQIFYYKFIFNLFFLRKILFFQPCRSNWQYCKLGTKNFFSFFIDILQQVHFRGRHIPDTCFFDSWVYNLVTLRSKLIPRFRNSQKLRKAVAIYETDELILSKKSLSLKTRGSEKVPLLKSTCYKLIFFN